MASPQLTIEEFRQRKREAAEQVRYILRELEMAEREFDHASHALQDALGSDAA